MLSSAQSVTPKPAAMPPAAPAAQAPLPGSGGAGGPSFAQFLNEQADLTPPQADPAPNDAETAGPSTAAPAPASTTAASRRKEGNATPAKPAQERAPEAAGTGKTAKDTQVAEASREAADPASEGDDKNPETAGLSEFTQIIGMAMPPQTVAPQPVTPGLPAAAAEAATESGVKGTRMGRAGRMVDEDPTAPAPRDAAADSSVATTAERRPADAHARGTDAAHAKGVELAADKAAAARGACSEVLQQVGVAAGGDAAPRMAAATDVAAPNFAAVLAQAMPATAATADAAPVSASGQVHAALHSHAFAPELGARVSLLAVDGVQQAELQLNPADMGPVAVQIVVDGTQAQVSFHAAQAETRQALEQSLPDLAAALQSQGLTLSGGGVFQQAQQGAKDGDAEAGSSGDGRGSRSNTGGGRIAASSTTAPARRTVGLLDTFA